MEQIDDSKKIEINNHIYDKVIAGCGEYIEKDALDRLLDDYYEQLDKQNDLLLHANIVRMNQIVSSDDDKHIIGTTALDTCYGILLYDRKDKKGIVGHADPTNIVSIVIQMLKNITLNDEKNIEYFIIPGYRAMEKGNFEPIEEIISILQYYSKINPKIKFISLKSAIDPKMSNGLLAYEFAFDTYTGLDVTHYVFNDKKSKHI